MQHQPGHKRVVRHAALPPEGGCQARLAALVLALVGVCVVDAERPSLARQVASTQHRAGRARTPVRVRRPAVPPAQAPRHGASLLLANHPQPERVFLAELARVGLPVVEQLAQQALAANRGGDVQERASGNKLVRRALGPRAQDAARSPSVARSPEPEKRRLGQARLVHSVGPGAQRPLESGLQHANDAPPNHGALLPAEARHVHPRDEG
mmetsp:Transcript_16809/g.32170  ORF Transcript_16809/g.32170 Transcript_16809/m.32170 type:complete len:210 (-) Transcript_16809:521-1150(-)